MVTCKNCGNVFNEVFEICPKCGTRYVAEETVGQEEQKIAALQSEAQKNEKKARKKKGKGKLAAVIGIVCVVIAAAVIALVMILNHSAVSAQAQEQITLGEKYFQNEEYDEAIIAFQKAIDIDTANADAYLHLEEAYRTVGNFHEAFKVLQKGYEQTGSAEIKKRLDMLYDGGADMKIEGQEVIENGSCGDGLSYKIYENGITVIEGSGKLEDTDKNNVIWRDKKVTEVYLQEGVSEIGKYAFRDCDTITYLSIPRSVVAIGEWAFNDNDRLTSIEVDPDNNYYSSKDGVLYNKERTILEHYPSGKWGTYVLPMTVQEVRTWAFAGAMQLRYIGVEAGNEAYSAYDGVLYSKDQGALVCYPPMRIDHSGSYTLPDTIKVIKAHAFYKDADLESIIVPASVEQVEFHAFERLSADQTIYFKGRDYAPGSWDNDWNYKCKAEIVFEPPEPEESSSSLPVFR